MKTLIIHWILELLCWFKNSNQVWSWCFKTTSMLLWIRNIRTKRIRLWCPFIRFLEWYCFQSMMATSKKSMPSISKISFMQSTKQKISFLKFLHLFWNASTSFPKLSLRHLISTTTMLCTLKVERWLLTLICLCSPFVWESSIS